MKISNRWAWFAWWEICRISTRQENRAADLGACLVNRWSGASILETWDKPISSHYLVYLLVCDWIRRQGYRLISLRKLTKALGFKIGRTRNSTYLLLAMFWMTMRAATTPILRYLGLLLVRFLRTTMWSSSCVREHEHWSLTIKEQSSVNPNLPS